MNFFSRLKTIHFHKDTTKRVSSWRLQCLLVCNAFLSTLALAFTRKTEIYSTVTAMNVNGRKLCLMECIRKSSSTECGEEDNKYECENIKRFLPQINMLWPITNRLASTYVTMCLYKLIAIVIGNHVWKYDQKCDWASGKLLTSVCQDNCILNWNKIFPHKRIIEVCLYIPLTWQQSVSRFYIKQILMFTVSQISHCRVISGIHKTVLGNYFFSKLEIVCGGVYILSRTIVYWDKYELINLELLDCRKMLNSSKYISGANLNGWELRLKYCSFFPMEIADN